MAEEFNRQKLMDNIFTLIQQKGLKIGEVETEAGISTGYLSRLNKKETDTAPGADIVWRIAKALGVSTDMLIEGNFSKVTDNYQLVETFLEKLKDMTEANLIEWDNITKGDFEEDLIGRENKIFIVIKSAEADKSFTVPYIQSIGAKGKNISVAGTSYKVQLDDDTRFYIFHLCTNEVIDDADKGLAEYSYDYYDLYFERWMVVPGFDFSYGCPSEGDYSWQVEPLCSTYGKDNRLEKPVKRLVEVVKTHEDDLRISSSLKEFLNSFVIKDRK
ncbi:MAG: helix-turn-helix domain-containing protein [Lachnospiraceae bacterium]|nr:helix-turn-helix domain-containing protein [Lachnospiraceae bacterium]